MSGQNKTEQATPRRQQKARERGQVARSRELSAALAALGCIVTLDWLAPRWIAEWRSMFMHFLDRAISTDLTLQDPLFPQAALMALGWAGAPVAVMGLLAALSLGAQGGFVFAPEALTPDWTRLNPANNVRQFFSLAALNRLLKSLLPLGALIGLAASIFLRDWQVMARSAGLSAGATLQHTLGLLYEFAWKACLLLLAWAGLDYGLQRAHLAQSLKMSKQEVRDEARETEGNPAIKGRIRRLQRSLRRRRMLKDVEKATVVITNPTEYAVALRYVPAEMPAPVVVAKGRNMLARKIKRVALWNDVPVLENKPLARALYKAAEVGQSIPAALYTAVAEILAFLMRLQSRARGAGQPEGTTIR